MYSIGVFTFNVCLNLHLCVNSFSISVETVKSFYIIFCSMSFGVQNVLLNSYDTVVLPISKGTSRGNQLDLSTDPHHWHNQHICTTPDWRQLQGWIGSTVFLTGLGSGSTTFCARRAVQATNVAFSASASGIACTWLCLSHKAEYERREPRCK